MIPRDEVLAMLPLNEPPFSLVQKELVEQFVDMLCVAYDRGYTDGRRDSALRAAGERIADALRKDLSR